MLTQLYIKNFTLIDELNISFRSGFSVITGETGAGKSIILGALGLVMGQRADVKAIKYGEERCLVEAHFDISNYDMQDFFRENDIDFDASDCIIRREVNTSGKSRAFINDTPVALSVLKDLGDSLIDIHSQHQNLLLNKEDFQLNVIDLIAGNADLLSDYRKDFSVYKTLIQKLQQLEENINQSKEREDFIRFQYKELADAKLEAGEQEVLEQEAETASHAEEIKDALFYAVESINGEERGVVPDLKTIVDRINHIVPLYPSVQEIDKRLQDCYIELKDISQDLVMQVDAIEFNPQRLAAVNERLNVLYSLEKKYRVNTVKELLDILQDLQVQLQHIDNSDDELSACRKQLEEMHTVCCQKAERLTAVRAKCAKGIEMQLQKMLVELGIPKAQFQVQMESKDLSPTGCDKVSFLFSANNDSLLQPVSQVASGGEIARVMLSLKALISHSVKLPTIIFDEIDTGVSGRVAERMAQMMAEMGENERQVIAITHLPQIAAMGKTHYQVFKEESSKGMVSKMIQLSDEERINEIAKMLSGSDVSVAAIDNAKSLLKIQ